MPIRALPPEREQEQTRIQARSREKTDENQGIAGTLKTLARKSIGNIYSGLQQLASAPPRKPPVSQLARPISPLPHTPFRASRDLPRSSSEDDGRVRAAEYSRRYTTGKAAPELDFNTAFVECSRAQTPTHAKRKHPPLPKKVGDAASDISDLEQIPQEEPFPPYSFEHIYTHEDAQHGQTATANLARDAPSTPRMRRTLTPESAPMRANKHTGSSNDNRAV